MEVPADLLFLPQVAQPTAHVPTAVVFSEEQKEQDIQLLHYFLATTMEKIGRLLQGADTTVRGADAA